MSLVVPISGEEFIVNLIVNVPMTLQLYSNDLVPDENTSIGDMTQVTWDGYAAASLSSGDWIVTDPSGTATATATQKTFTFEDMGGNDTLNLYGYYVTNSSNVILWLERFQNAPIQIPPTGGELSMAARFTFTTASSG